MIKHATFTTAFLLISLAGCAEAEAGALAETTVAEVPVSSAQSCLLYTSDAADE